MKHAFRSWFRSWPALVLSGIGLFAFVDVLHAQAYGDPNQPYDRLPGMHETYHVKWMKPFAGGKLKVLFIISYPQSREVIEAAQRIDLDYTVIMCSGHKTWSTVRMDASGARQLQKPASDKLLQQLVTERLGLEQHYDAIIIGKIGWPVIPTEVRELILKHVERGTGLVYLCPNLLLNAEDSGWGHRKEYAKKGYPEFSQLFEQPDPALAARLLSGLPMDLLPIEPLENPGDFVSLPGVPEQQLAQRRLCITSARHGAGRIIGVDTFDEALTVSAATTSLAWYVDKTSDPARPFDPVMYDYAYALLARCLAACSGREPAVKARIEFEAAATDLEAPVDETLRRFVWRLPKPETVIDRTTLDQACVRFQIETPSDNHVKLALNYQIRDLKGLTLASGVVSAPASATPLASAAIPLPILPRGTYLIDLRIMNDATQIVTFASAGFRIESRQQVATLTTEQDRYHEGETINGHFEFAQELAPGESVAVMAVDTWGRTVALGETALQDGRKTGTFQLAVHAPLSRIWDVFCAVRDTSGPIDVRQTWVGLPDWTLDDFVVLLELMALPGEAHWKGLYWPEVARQYGVNAAAVSLIYDRVYQYEAVERAHYRNVTFAEHFGQDPDQLPYDQEASKRCLSEFGRMCRHVAETGCLLDPDRFPYRLDFGAYALDAKWINSRIGRYLESARIGSPYYMLTGEGYLSGEFVNRENSCFCSLCTQRFRDWCQRQYTNDLNALNREWGSELKSWDEVRGILLHQAAERDQLPRWVDFRHFMRSEVWTQFFIDWTDMVRRFVPEFVSGKGGHDHHDFTRYRKHMTASKVYGFQNFNSEWKDIMQAEVIQSFAEKPLVISSMGVSADLYDFRTPVGNVRIPWRALFMGFYGFDWERGYLGYYDCLGGDSSMTADLSEPLPFFANIGREVRFIQRGIGKLTLASEPYRSKVAVLWAPYNHYISRLEPFQKRGFSGTINYNTQVTGGAHSDCLALMQALRIRPLLVSPDDVASGKLVAQGYGALLLPYSKGMSVAEADAIRAFAREGGVVIADNTPGVYSEHGRKLETPRLYDLFPDLTNACATVCGEGRAFYLPNGINGFVDRFDENDFAQAEQIGVILREAAGIAPPVELLDPRGLPRRDTLMPLFIRGSARLLGLMRASSSGGGAETTTVRLDAPGWVWDVRAGECLGRTDTFTVELDHAPRYYALLPVAIRSMNIKGSHHTTAGRDYIVTGRIRFGDGDQKAAATLGQVVHLEVIGPDGKERECFRRNILFDGSQFTTTLPFSFSEAPGPYTVEVAHAITGMRTSLRVIVRPSAAKELL